MKNEVGKHERGVTLKWIIPNHFSLKKIGFFWEKNNLSTIFPKIENIEILFFKNQMTCFHEQNPLHFEGNDVVVFVFFRRKPRRFPSFFLECVFFQKKTNNQCLGNTVFTEKSVKSNWT